MTTLILRIVFAIQSVGISAVLLVGIWTRNIFGWTVAENTAITVWIAAPIICVIAYSAISLYKKLRYEED